MSDPDEHEIVGRDPITKTIVEDFARSYPDLTDAQLCGQIRLAGRSVGADLSKEITPEIVAHWRPAVPA